MESRYWVEILKNNDCLEDLKNNANFIKTSVYGNKVFLRGIIEFSNYCRKNCLYCGIRKDNKDLKRYRMGLNEILNRAERIVNSGIKTIVLQSGEDIFYTKEVMSTIIYEIKKKYDVAITLCIGERTEDEYKAFKDCGADRFLMKHETSNEKIYEKMHPGESFKRRLKLIETLKNIGYQVGSGNIIGLPYTTTEDYVNDIFLIKKFDLDMAGLGPFMPTKNTPLQNFSAPDIGSVLKILAISRIILKDVNIPATTALFSLGGIKAIEDAFDCGANVLMPNFTGDEFRRNYKIYDNKKPLNMKLVHKILKRKGLQISNSKGERKKLYDNNYEIGKKKSNFCWQN